MHVGLRSELIRFNNDLTSLAEVALKRDWPQAKAVQEQLENQIREISKNFELKKPKADSLRMIAIALGHVKTELNKPNLSTLDLQIVHIRMEAFCRLCFGNLEILNPKPLAATPKLTLKRVLEPSTTETEQAKKKALESESGKPESKFHQNGSVESSS